MKARISYGRYGGEQASIVVNGSADENARVANDMARVLTNKAGDDHRWAFLGKGYTAAGFSCNNREYFVNIDRL